jgi:hypothetical protein
VAWADWVRDARGNALVLPVVGWFIDTVAESMDTLVRLDYGLDRSGQAQALVQLKLTPDQLLELANDLAAAALSLRRTIESDPIRKRA